MLDFLNHNQNKAEKKDRWRGLKICKFENVIFFTYFVRRNRTKTLKHLSNFGFGGILHF